MGLETTPDGRQVWLPDDLSDEQKLKALENYIANTPLQVEEEVEEEVIETPDEVVSEEVIEEEFIPPVGKVLSEDEREKLRTDLKIGPVEEGGYEQGEWFGETSKTEGEDFWSLLGKSFTGTRSVLEEWGRGPYSLDNLKEIAFQIDALETEEAELRIKDIEGTLTDDESLRLQEIHKILNGSGKSDDEVRADIAERITSLPPSFEPNTYGGANLIPFGEEVSKEEKGLYRTLEEGGVESARRSNALADAELSNASKYVFTAGQGSWENTREAFRDLTAPQKMDFMGDVVGMSGASTLLILLASFGTAGALRLAGASGLTNFLGTGLATGGASYGVENVHSFYEYLKAEGLDVTDRNSIIEIFNNEELIEEAEDYANTRGLIIGSIDGLTGGLATKIMAPTMVTRSTRGIMPYIYKPTGATLPRAGLRATGDAPSPANRFMINFALQTPTQVTLPAGAEYFAQLATLEEGQLINFGEVLAEGIGEFAFVPADLALGTVATRQAYKNYSPKEESNRKVNKAVTRRMQQAKDKGLGHLAHKGDAVLDPQSNDSIIRTTGIPFFERAWDVYNQFWDSIPTFAKSSNPKLIAPNQFFVGKDGQGGFQIKDSHDRKVGESFATEEEAAGVSGAFNIISQSRYTNEVASGTLESLGIQDSEFGIELGSLLNDPYFNTVELGEIVTDDLKITNRAAFERILNAVGRDATTFDIQVIKKALSEKDFNILMKAKADSLSDRTRGVKSPTRVSRKTFENLKKKLNVEIDTKSDTFKRLSQRLTGESNYNKLSNAQKSFIYSFLSSLPAHEGDTISLPDLTSRTWLKEDYSRVVDSLFNGNPPTINHIATILGLDPNNINSKRTATRLRNDLLSAGIIEKRGTKYVLNKGGAWSLNRQAQQDLATDPNAQENLKQNLDYLENLKKALVEMNIPELNLNVIPMLDSEIERAHSVRDDGIVGIYNPALRQVMLDVVSAVRSAKNKAGKADVTWDAVYKELLKTLTHETGHGAMDLDLFSPSEKKNFRDSTKAKKISRSLVNEIFGDKTTFMKLRDRLGRAPTYMDVAEIVYSGTTPENIQEEASMMLLEDIHEGKSKVVGQPRALANRLTKFLESIYRGFDEAGFQTTEDIYDKLISGEIGARTRTDVTKEEVTVESYDEFGRPQETYQISRPASRTNIEMERYYQHTYSMLSSATGQTVDTDENFSEDADAITPTQTRPLSDIPNLKFKLSEEQRRPTSLTSQFTSSARSGEYGNNLAHIPQVIFEKGIIGDSNMIRRFGRELQNKEVGATQKQLYQYTQENLAKKGFPDHPTAFRVYGVGDVDRSISTNVVTNNRLEAEMIANGFINPPFEIKGDKSKITAYTVTRPSLVLNNAILFDGRIPAWAQVSYQGSEYLHIGSSRLVTADSQEIEYEFKEPPTIPDKRIFSVGTGKTIPVPPRKPFPSMKYKLSGLTGDLFDISSSPVGHIGSENYSDVFTVFNKSPNRLEESLDRLRKWTKNPELTEAQVDKAAQEIMDITQVSLDAFPQQIRVYRGGMKRGAEIRSDEVVPVTLSPEVAKSFAFNRKNMLGRFSLQSWLIDKSEALVNIDAFQPLGYWENELLVNGDSLRIAEETAEAQDNLDYVDYMAPETLNRVRDTVATYNATKTERQINKALTKFNFPFNFFPEASASETMLREMGESAVASSFYKVPDLSERKKTAPRNTYRFPYGEDFAEYMAQPEEKRRGKWITDRLKQYPTPAYMVGQKDIKYKLARPMELQYSQDPKPEGDRTIDMTPLVIGPETFEGDYDIGLVVNKTKVKAEFMGRPFETRTDPQGNFASEFVILARPNRQERKFVFDDEIGRVIAYVDNNSIYERPKVLGIQDIQIDEEARGTGIGQQVTEILGSTNPDIVNGTDTLKLYDITPEGAPVWNAMGANMFVRQNLDARTRIDGEIDFTRTEPIGETSPEVLNYFQSTAEALERFTIESITVERDIKYKLAYPITDQEFIESKTNLAELLDSGTPVNDLMEHPAIVEAERRMMAIPETIDKYLQRYGESWALNPSYLNNREFVIDGKKVKGVKNVIDAAIKKAESYADGRVGDNKIAWYFLGPPASGKSYFAETVATDNKLAIIDNDDIKRFIPEYGDGIGANAVHREASMLSKLATKEMLRRNKDVLIPKVGGINKRAQVLDDVRNLKELGYTVNLVVVDVAQPMVESRMYTRFINTGRLIPPSYIASVGNTPVSTYHRVKYITDDGFAWIDNNGRQQQEIIREDTGILPASIGRERGTVGERIGKISDPTIQEVVSEDLSETRAVSIEEAIEGAKGINERLVSAGYTAKFNLNASADAIYFAYKQELTKDTVVEVPNALRKKYSLKGGKKLDEVAEGLISRLTIRDELSEDTTIGESILKATEFFTIENLREQLVDQYATFATSEAVAQRARGFGEEQLLASTSAISAAMFSDRSGEIWKGSFMEGFPIYAKGYVHVAKLSPMDGKPVIAPMEFMRPLFRNPNNLWLWNAIRVVKRETRFDQEGRKVRITAQDKKDAKKILKENPWLNEVSEAYDRWDAHVVQFLVDTQVLDENTAKQWTANADYFPFYRVLAIDEGDDVRTRGPQIFKGMHPFGKNIFIKAKGSETKKTLDPITAISQNLRAAIVLGMKNVAANRVMRNMIDAGQAEQVPLSSKDSRVVKTRVGGKNKAFRVLDRPLYEAFQNFADGQMPMGGFLSAAAIPKRVVSESITRVPVFWGKQVIRDGLAAGTLLGTGVFSTVFRSMGNAVRLANGKLLAQVPGATEEMMLPEGYFKLRNAGVVTRYDQVIADYEDANKVVKEAYRQAGIRNIASIEGIKGLPFDILMGVWDVLGQGTIITDTSTRLVVYDEILKETGDEAEAIFQAMEILNFTRRGKNRLVQIFATLLPFQNPRWQGMDVFARAYTGTYGKKAKGGKPLTKRERQTAVWFRTAMFMSLTPLYYMAVKDTDEYKEMSEEERELYWIIPGLKKWLGFTPRIPKPFELGVIFGTLPEMLLRVMDERETWRDVREAMWRQMTGTLKLAPWEVQVTRPIAEVAFNYDFFTGQPVVSERPSAPTDPKLQRRSTTPNAYVEVGEALNMSPLKVQKIWEGYTGPYGAYIAMVADGLITNYVNPEAPTLPSTGWEKSLFIGGLVHPAESSGLVNEFYKLQGLTDEFLANTKAMEDLLEVGDKRTYHYDDIYQLQYVDTVKKLKNELNQIAYLDKGKNLAEIRDAISVVTNDNDRTPDEKREIILELKNLRNELLREARTLRVSLETGMFDQIEEFVEEKERERNR